MVRLSCMCLAASTTCTEGPIRHRKRRYILTADQSDTGIAGIFSRQTNQTQEAQVYSHGGPTRQMKHGNNIASFYGSSCANDGKDALDTPEAQ
eukprot:4186719-Pyramimonas_sp.AAC.1